MNDYGPDNNRGYTYVLVVIEKFSNFGWTVPLKKENSQTLKDSFENIFINSKRSLNLVKTDRGNEFLNELLTDFLKKTISKVILETLLQELFLQNALIVLLEIFLKDLFFFKGVGKRIDVLPKKAKQYNNIINWSTKLTLIQASLKKNEGYVYKKLLDR